LRRLDLLGAGGWLLDLADERRTRSSDVFLGEIEVSLFDFFFFHDLDTNLCCVSSTLAGEIQKLLSILSLKAQSALLSVVMVLRAKVNSIIKSAVHSPRSLNFHSPFSFPTSISALVYT